MNAIALLSLLLRLGLACLLGWGIMTTSLSAQNGLIYRDSILTQARQYVDTLCSPTFAGRGYLNDGHIKAANYIQEQFHALGLKALASDGYQQPFLLEINLPRQASLTLNRKALKIGHDFIIHKLSGTGLVEGKVIDAGYGLEPSSKAKGKILLFRSGWPAELANDAEKRKPFQSLNRLPDRINAWLAFEPAAILIVQQKLTAGFTRQSFPLPILEVLASSLPQKVRKAQIQAKSELTRLRSQNVIGGIPGTKHIDTAITICAHYDHLGQTGDAIFTGANDNAAGIAMLLSMAQHFAQPKNQLPYSLIFIAFGGEETGLVGSNYYANEASLFPLAQTKFLLNLDLMGNGIDGITAVGGKENQAPFSLLQSLNDSLQAVPIVRARNNAPNSDHYFFLKQGVPGFFIYTLGGPTHYHDVYDNPTTIELSRYVEVRDLLIALLSAICKIP